MKIFLRFGVAGLYVVTNGKISFVCFVLLRRASFLSVNLTLKSRLLCSKFSLTELVLKRRNASAFIKPFLQFEGWQDEKRVY